MRTLRRTRRGSTCQIAGPVNGLSVKSSHPPDGKAALLWKTIRLGIVRRSCRWLAVGTVIASTAVLLFSTRPASAQQVRIDKGVQAAGLWCFPLATNEKEYRYIPAEAHLGVDKTGGPEFSFIRYVENKKSTGDGPDTITDASGGGVLHFLALYDTPEETVSKADKALKEALNDTDVKLGGPIVFTGGRYVIVSSVAQVDSPGGAGGQKMVAIGNAPVLEGNKIAISMQLDKRNTQILYNSFQMAHPDISVMFEMDFEGITPGYDATVDIDWSEVVKDEQYKAGANVYFVSADIQMGFQRLMRNNAIKLVSRGEDSSTEALLNTVYSKLLDLLFRKVEEPPPPQKELGLIDALAGALGGKGKGIGFGISASYQLKEMQSSGHSILNFNHQAVVHRSSLLTFNIGDLFKRYGQNPDYFKAVNLADPVYAQREVLVSVDGSLLQDFGKYINSVTVTVKKDHDNGNSTLGEVVVDRNSFTEKANQFSVVYGWDGDTDREKWLDYQYRVKWSFQDGGTLQGDWKTTSSPMVNVMAPYERREITVQGDPDAMKKAAVKYALVHIGYDFFGKPRNKQILTKAGDPAGEQKIEIIQPQGEYKYKYDIRWHMVDGRDVSKPTATDTSGLIFVDELPAG